MFVRLLAWSLIGAFALFNAPAAKADWYEAQSDHFVIYADDSEKDIRRFATNLERYHRAMELLLGVRVEKPSPSNRVVIFVVGSGRELRKVAGENARNIAGFYVPRAGASRAFVQDIRNKRGYPHFSTTVLLHEYAHHFLISSTRFAMPRWLGEGAAEFFAAASFEQDGGVLIGRVARHRAGELSYVNRIDLPGLLSHGSWDARREDPGEAFYGRSWLLYHYLTFSPERQGQIDAYSRAMAGGMTSIEAARTAFGDLDTLERELTAYKRSRRFNMLMLEPEKLEVGPVTVRELPEGEAAVLPLRIRSQRGVNEQQAAELVVEVREVAIEYPNDAGVLAALAEAEFDAGNDEAAIDAADRAMAIDPTRTNPYVQKGFALFRRAGGAPESEREAAFEEAMEPFTKLNQLENDHPIPLIFYYRSYAERGISPPEQARLALERAAQLAPFDKSLWFDVAMMQMQEGKIDLAKASLQPLANDPHGGSRAVQLRQLIDWLDTIPEGKSLEGSEIAAALMAGVVETVPNDPIGEGED